MIYIIRQIKIKQKPKNTINKSLKQLKKRMKSNF